MRGITLQDLQGGGGQVGKLVMVGEDVFEPGGVWGPNQRPAQP
jgi:hypothetical protein